MQQPHGRLSLPLLQQPVKHKSVTSPLNEAVRASICGNLPTTDIASATQCSSDHDIDSERLADMIYGCDIVDQDQSGGELWPSDFAEGSNVDVLDSNTPHFMALFTEQLCEILEGVSNGSSTAFEMRLMRDVENAVAMASQKAGFNTAENTEQKSRSRRFVLNSLLFAGYNAAVCKSQWEKRNGHPSGDYEFIDVVIEGPKLKKERFFVDIDLRAQFEIARPTDDYNALLQKIPNLFVGRAEKLCGIMKIMCGAARRSLKERGMCLPPWRKYRYMQAKWLGSYKRTTNPAVQGTGNEYGAFLQFPTSETDASVVLVNNMEKARMGTEKNLTAKSKSAKQDNERLESGNRLLSGKEQDRKINKISGLATASSNAGLPSSSHSNRS